MNKIRVLIIDDSAVMRRFISEQLAASSVIEVVATALDPYIAADKITRYNPDVITLDIEMPRMDGLTFLSRLMRVRPMPVIMVSSHTAHSAEQTIKALQLGAMDFICKPSIDNHEEIEDFKKLLIEKVITANKSARPRSALKSMKIQEKYDTDAVLEKKGSSVLKKHTEKIVAIGASTGGTEILEAILVRMDVDVPGIVIAQHMPEKFTEAFANRVNELTPVLVKEGAQGDRVFKGTAFIAPGGRHMMLNSDSEGYYIEINDGPPVNRHRPSVDVLFRSVSQNAGNMAAGILCTGMGSDGAKGLLEMRETGAVTVAQDEGSSTVYGMPREAVKLGAAQHEMNPQQMVEFIRSLK